MRVTRAVDRLFRSERGAIFVQIGISILVLMGFSVFVIDQGVMFAARAQAQRSADAAALAGAVTRGFDDFTTPPPSNGEAANAARAVAAVNKVWEAAPVVDVAFDCPGGASGRCVRVDVYRDSAHGNALPMFFGPILGITSQGVRAQATARVRGANAVECIRPLAFADEWDEHTGAADQFNRYNATGGLLSGTPDSYSPPTPTYAGNRTVSADIGERIIYQLDQNPLTAPITRQLVVPVHLPNPWGPYENTKHCSGDTIRIGDTIPIEHIAYAGWQASALSIVMAQDPGATWNEGQNRMETTCVPGCGNLSPRFIAVPIYDPDKLQKGRTSGNWTQPSVGCPTAFPCITVVNIAGFFIHGSFAGYGPHGHYLPFPGVILPDGPPSLADDAAWVAITHLVR